MSLTELKTSGSYNNCTLMGTPNYESRILRVHVLPTEAPYEMGRALLNPADLNLSSERNYIRIANRVYRVGSAAWIKKGFIGLHPEQWATACKAKVGIKKDGSDALAISFFNTPPRHLSEICIEVAIDPNQSERREKPPKFYADTLRQYAKKAFEQNHFAYQQEVLIPYDHGMFLMQVVAMVECFRDHRGFSLMTGEPYFGFVSEHTAFKFRAMSATNINIIQGRICDDNAELYLTLHSKNEAASLNRHYPKLVDVDKIRRVFLDCMVGRELSMHEEFTLRSPGLGAFSARFSTVDFNDLKDEEQYSFVVAKNQKVRFVGSSDITLIKGRPALAKKIEITILSATKLENPEEDASWINADLLKNRIMRIGSFIARQSITLELGDARIHFRFSKISEGKPNSFPLPGLQKHWKANQTTDIQIELDDGLEISLVSKSAECNLKAVTLHLEMPYCKKRRSIPEKELLEKLKEQIGKELAAGTEITLKIAEYPELIATVASLDFEKVDETPFEYEKLGTVTAQTVFKLHSSDNDLKITTPFPEGILKNPKAFLEEQGVGGMSKDCISQLQKIVLMHTKAKGALLAAGIKPPKGLMLAGPPGTGKTNLATQLGKILGIPESNVGLHRGPEVFNMWEGNSEKNVRKMFADAIEEFKAYGNASSPYLIIIDEIDAMLAARGGTSKSRDSVVTQFISIVDGLERLDNIIVIGITNRVETIDSAVLRPGRLNPTIKIGMPDHAGRLAIFRIHTKELQAKDQLGGDVDLEALAKKTDKLSGADIAGVIQDAYMSWALKIALAPEGEHPKLMMQDLEEALETLKTRQLPEDTRPEGTEMWYS